MENENSRTILHGPRGGPGLFVVAIGLPAARIARDELNSPIVFAQIFNYQELLVTGRSVRGVTAMPPLDLQVQDWKKIDSKLRQVGLIVSQEHADLIPQAERAAKAAGLTIKYEISDSDRETLYVFKPASGLLRLIAGSNHRGLCVENSKMGLQSISGPSEC